jgi:hypothetical protein
MLNKVTIAIGNDQSVIAEVINGYRINLKFTTVPQIISNDDEICSLKVGKGSLSLFDELKVPIDGKIMSVYEVNKIEKLTDKAYSVYTTIETKTKQFILPCLDFNREYFLYDTFLENAYINVSNISLDLSSIKCPLALLYRYSESELFKAFETKIVKHPYFRHRIDVTTYEVLYVFDIVPFKADVDKFLQGKYSTLSEKLKKSIIQFHNYTEGGTMYQILNKDSKLKQQLELQFNVQISNTSELYSIPEIEDETYKFMTYV